MAFLRSWAVLLVLFAEANSRADEKQSPKPSPTCLQVHLDDPKNNAKDIADSLNGIAEGITVKALSDQTLMVCGDDTRNAVSSIKNAIPDLGMENKPKGAAHESHVIRLSYNRDAASVAAILQKAFPKLNVTAMGNDVIALGSADGSDAPLVSHARRWVAALDVPRTEVTLNAWSVQISDKDPAVIEIKSQKIRNAVAEFNRRLQEGLQRSHAYLTEASKVDGFYAVIFRDYLAQRYAIAAASGQAIDEKRWNACPKGTYCLGYYEIFHVQPTVSSLLVNVLAAKDSDVAGRMVDRLENRPVEGHSAGQRLVQSRGYSSNTQTTLATIYKLPVSGELKNCEDTANAAYDGDLGKTAPLFPCLREALSDATEPISLARVAQQRLISSSSASSNCNTLTISTRTPVPAPGWKRTRPPC